VKHTPRLETAHERQERESCLSCVLPECIPDHPACALHGDTESRRRRVGTRLCSQCIHSILVPVDHPLLQFYFYCPEWGYNTMGWRKNCSRFRVRPQHQRARSLRRKEQKDASRRKTR